MGNIMRYYQQEGPYRASKEDIVRIKNACIVELADRLSKQSHLAEADDEVKEKLIMNIVLSLSSRTDLQKKDRDRLVTEVKNEAFGFGPLEALIHDTELSEIMVNGPEDVKVEAGGIIYDTDITFDDEAHVRRIISKIVTPTGRHIDDANPMVDTRLPDGSRVNAIIPPVSLNGPCMTIRKFSPNPYRVKDFLQFHTFNQQMSEFLSAAVEARMNVLISGGTGSGKTTLMNVISEFIPESERIITIEDAAELKLLQPHVIRLEARTANLEGAGEITIRDLVRNALRMRPDRIIVGEVRSGESLDMLQAMNTGHDGSLTTIHANSPRDALSRVQTTALMSGLELPADAIKQQIASAFNLIVHTARLRDGSRKVTSITEVVGMMGEQISTQEIYKFVYDVSGRTLNPGETVPGHFTATGVHPKCLEKMQDNGVAAKVEWFRPY